MRLSLRGGVDLHGLRDHLPVLIVMALWLAALAVATPTGEFPTNDDWCYSRAVQSLVDTGHIYLPPEWAAMTLFMHVLWGTLFCVPFGFSFFTLRLSTIVMGVLGLAGTHVLLRDLKYDRYHALIGLAVLAFSPWYFHLSCSYMTDVPFAALSIWATVFLLRNLRTGSRRALYAGLAINMAALLIRQYALLLPIGWGFAQVLPGRLTRRTLWHAAWPAVLTLIVLLVFQGWISPRIGMGGLYNARIGVLAREIQQPLLMLRNDGGRCFIMTLYLGLTSLPLCMVAFSRARPESPLERGRRWRWFAGSLAALAALLVVQLVVQSGKLMPLATNVLFDLGMGPPTLRDVFYLHAPHLPQGPRWAWAIVTGVAVLSAAGMLASLIRQVTTCWRERTCTWERSVAGFVLVAFGGYFAILSVTGFYDRYLIHFIPALLILLAVAGFHRAQPSRAWRVTAIIPLLFIALFDVAATHDYFAWNRARWHALIDLMANGIGPERVDGGFEFNGWYNYYPPSTNLPNESGWWVIDNEYLIAFGPVPDYTVQTRYPYPRWLWWGQGYIHVLHRNT